MMDSSTKNTLVTIITAVYNGGKPIEDTIKSILYQSYTHIEFILVDGASTDNSVEIIKKYESAFHGRMKWISEPDKGIYDAWNKGSYL